VRRKTTAERCSAVLVSWAVGRGLVEGGAGAPPSPPPTVLFAWVGPKPHLRRFCSRRAATAPPRRFCSRGGWGPFVRVGSAGVRPRLPPASSGVLLWDFGRSGGFVGEAGIARKSRGFSARVMAFCMSKPEHASWRPPSVDSDRDFSRMPPPEHPQRINTRVIPRVLLEA
jgi:hypothetical protein